MGPELQVSRVRLLTASSHRLCPGKGNSSVDDVSRGRARFFTNWGLFVMVTLAVSVVACFSFAVIGQEGALTFDLIRAYVNHVWVILLATVIMVWVWITDRDGGMAVVSGATA